MCLGIPGKVIEVFESNGVRMGRVDFSGIQKEICLFKKRSVWPMYPRSRSAITPSCMSVSPSPDSMRSRRSRPWRSFSNSMC